MIRLFHAYFPTRTVLLTLSEAILQITSAGVPETGSRQLNLT